MWFEKHGRYIELWGEFNAKVLLAKNEIIDVDNDLINGKKVGDRVEVSRGNNVQDGIVVGQKNTNEILQQGKLNDLEDFANKNNIDFLTLQKRLEDLANSVDDVLDAVDLAKLRANSAAHTIERHGFEVIDDLLKRRATEGIAPDGSSIPKKQGGQRIGNVIPPMSSKFKDTASMKKALNAVDESTDAFQNALAAERLAKGTNTPSQFKFQIDLEEAIGLGYKRPAGANNYVLTGQRLSGTPIKVDSLKKVEVWYKLNRTTGKYEINTMFPIE